MNTKIEASEMPLQNDGSIYHLHLHPEQLAENCILVGDPGRVPTVSAYFDRIDFKVSNRELVTHTGELNGKRISVLSTGMGTDNIDIVVNELDALVNIDLKTREPKNTHKSLNLVRIGTSGSLQPDYPVDSFCASSFGLGLDGLLNYYQIPQGILEEEMGEAFRKHAGFPESFARPYIVGTSQELFQKIGFDMLHGITATAPGFFAPQGRVLRLGLTFPEQNDRLASFRHGDLKISNLEMETSALYGLGRALGHKTLTVCALIANRATKDFSKDYKPIVTRLIETVLERLTK